MKILYTEIKELFCEQLETIEKESFNDIAISQEDLIFFTQVGLPSKKSLINFTLNNDNIKLFEWNGQKYLELGGDLGYEYGIVIAMNISNREIWQVDKSFDLQDRFVNSTIQELIFFLGYWNKIVPAKDYPNKPDELHTIYETVDKKALSDLDSFWSCMLVQITDAGY